MKSLAKTKIFKVYPFNPEDAANLAGWLSPSARDLFMASSSLVYPLTPRVLINRAKNADSREHKFYSVFLVKSGEGAGYFEIKNINRKSKVGTAAHIILSSKYRGKGMGRDFIEVISRVGFIVLGLHRIGLSVHTTNGAAITAYARAGYVCEGLIREVLLFKGKRYSLYQMSLLRREWKNNIRRKK